MPAHDHGRQSVHAVPASSDSPPRLIKPLSPQSEAKFCPGDIPGNRYAQQIALTLDAAFATRMTMRTGYVHLPTKQADDYRRTDLLLSLDQYPVRSLFHPTGDIAHRPNLSRGMRRNHHRLPFQLGFARRTARRALHDFHP